VQPGGEEALDLSAAAGPLEAAGDGAALDDEQRRHALDSEALEQVGAFLLRDSHERESAVVAATLQHLREESLDTPTMAGQCRVEEDKPRLWLYGWADRRHVAPPVVQKGEDLALR
jgi:hypothetical protein